MSRAIWKEPLEAFHSGPGNYMLSELSLPTSAAILNVDQQGEQFCVWFSVRTDQADVTARFLFAIVPTGGDIPEGDSVRHLGTVMQDGGVFVWHVFLVSISPE